MWQPLHLKDAACCCKHGAIPDGGVGNVLDHGLYGACRAQASGDGTISGNIFRIPTQQEDQERCGGSPSEGWLAGRQKQGPSELESPKLGILGLLFPQNNKGSQSWFSQWRWQAFTTVVRVAPEIMIIQLNRFNLQSRPKNHTPVKLDGVLAMPVFGELPQRNNQHPPNPLLVWPVQYRLHSAVLNFGATCDSGTIELCFHLKMESSSLMIWSRPNLPQQLKKCKFRRTAILHSAQECRGDLQSFGCDFKVTMWYMWPLLPIK